MLSPGRRVVSAVLIMALGGCGSSRSVDLAEREPAPHREPASALAAPVAPAEIAVTAPMAADIDALERIPVEAREEITLFAHSTLQLQRVALLQESRIQQELMLTAQDIEQFEKLAQEVEAMKSTLQTLSGDARREKLRNDYRPKAVEYQQLVDAALNEAQERTLFRRVLQRQRGAIIFLLPGVPEELQLTAEQQAFLYELIETTRQSVNLDNLSNPIELGRIYMKANAARKKAEEQLTAEQRAAWDRMLEN